MGTLTSPDIAEPKVEVYTGPLRVVDKIRRTTAVKRNDTTDTGDKITQAVANQIAQAATERNIKAVAQSLEATLTMAEAVDDMEMLPLHLRHDELKHFVAYIKMLDAEYRRLDAHVAGLQKEYSEVYQKYVKLKGAISEPEKGKTAAPDSNARGGKWDTYEKFGEIERRVAERDQRAGFDARNVSVAQKANKKWSEFVSRKVGKWRRT